MVTAGAEWSITIVPPPSAEAPRKIEVWTERNGSAVRRVSVSGDSWAVSADGRVKMLGHGVDKVHDHGGPPAFIGGAGFEIQSERDTPVRVSVVGIDWLVGAGCAVPSEVKAHPAFAEIREENSEKGG